MKNLLLAFSALAVIFNACTLAPPADTKPDLDALRVEFQAMEDAFAAGQLAKDADAVAAYYADDAVSLDDGGPKLTGKAAITEKIRNDMAADTLNHISTFTVEDVFADGDLAVEVGASVTKDADGNTVSTGKYISVFQKRDGKYLCIRDAYNKDSKPQ